MSIWWLWREGFIYYDMILYYDLKVFRKVINTMCRDLSDYLRKFVKGGVLSFGWYVLV